MTTSTKGLMQPNLLRSASSLLSKDKYYHGIGGSGGSKRNKHQKNNGSHTSLHGMGSDTGSGRRGKRRSDEPEENKKGEAFLLDEDFKLMAAVSPPPTEVFCAKSVEHKLAEMWYEKLTSWRPESIYDRRLRNHYMSYYCVCLNQRELRGLFKEVPPEELTWVNFRESIDAASCCKNKQAAGAAGGGGGNDSSWQQGSPAGGGCGLGAGGGCCGGGGAGGGGVGGVGGAAGGGCCSRRTGGVANMAWTQEVVSSSSRRKIPQRTTHNLSYKTRPKLVPRHMDNGVLATSGDADAMEHSSSTLCSLEQKEIMMQKQQLQAASPAAARPLPQPVRNSRPICHIDMEARRDMTYLLETIKCELRGDRQEDADDYLELEIRRYRDFYMRHRRNDPDFNRVMNEVNTPRERVYMLLNMQNDLVKLLQ